ncbi:hypothetical protein ACP4OV_008178 [Aristida adscensionis]
MYLTAYVEGASAQFTERSPMQKPRIYPSGPEFYRRGGQSAISNLLSLAASDFASATSATGDVTAQDRFAPGRTRLRHWRLHRLESIRSRPYAPPPPAPSETNHQAAIATIVFPMLIAAARATSPKDARSASASHGAVAPTSAATRTSDAKALGEDSKLSPNSAPNNSQYGVKELDVDV